MPANGRWDLIRRLKVKFSLLQFELQEGPVHYSRHVSALSTTPLPDIFTATGTHFEPQRIS